MQKRLVMIRHAKSSWADPGMADYDRPLNERGKHDAPMMGEVLKQKDLLPDLIISSSAKRARQTAKKIAKAIGYDEDSIELVDKLYHCRPATFEEVIYGIDDNTQTVYIVAHNPGITDFVNGLSAEFATDNMPTTGIVAAYVHTDKWNEFATADKKVFLFDYPKNHK